jgi:hypothetical protein
MVAIPRTRERARQLPDHPAALLSRPRFQCRTDRSLPAASRLRSESALSGPSFVAFHGLPRPLRTLDTVDLSDYGRPRQLSRLDNLSAGITTPLDLPEAKIAELVNEAMTRMTEDAGFRGGATPPCTG